MFIKSDQNMLHILSKDFRFEGHKTSKYNKVKKAVKRTSEGPTCSGTLKH